MTNTPDPTTWHVGRSWPPNTPLEDACPCPKERCGLVACATADPDCVQHGRNHPAKTMRQGHAADRCPGGRTEATDAA